MISSELERLVIERKSKGHIPFFVNCTSGTTVHGAFDPIEEIADICQKYKMWLHIDVSLVCSPKGEVGKFGKVNVRWNYPSRSVNARFMNPLQDEVSSNEV